MKITRVLALTLAIGLMVAPSALACTSQFGACTSVSEIKRQGVTPQVAQGGSASPQLAAMVLAETNGDRAKAGLPPLQHDEELSRAAAVRAREIVQKFSHTRPNGEASATVHPRAKAENIAKGQQTVAKVMAAWMSSAGHRRNILRKSSTSVGICAYQSGGIMYWVQIFN